MNGVDDILQREARRTCPDYITYVPKSLDPSSEESHNEHFLVFEGPGDALSAVWTQALAPESGPANRILFSRSEDDGASLLRRVRRPMTCSPGPGYYPWPVEGYYRFGGSGRKVNASAYEAIHTLNHYCPYEDYENNVLKPGHSRARGNAVWAFFGHANPFCLGFGGNYPDGAEPAAGDNEISNTMSNPANMVYRLDWNIDFVRLAYLMGCSTAGGLCEYANGQTSQVPDTASMMQTFHDQGADAVVAWKDFIYPNSQEFRDFNQAFWYELCRHVATVRDAVALAKASVPRRRFADRRYRTAVMNVRYRTAANTSLAPPAYGD